MKTINLLILGLFGLMLTASAQAKSTGKAEIKTPSVQCEMCKSRIEKYLLRQYGVTGVKVDVKKKVTGVTWLTDRTNIENIKAAIATAGYDADDVTAEETAYKKLPPCCKKPDSAATNIE
jgi:periplasmic mercuric ion binding protein